MLLCRYRCLHSHKKGKGIMDIKRILVIEICEEMEDIMSEIWGLSVEFDYKQIETPKIVERMEKIVKSLREIEEK